MAQTVTFSQIKHVKAQIQAIDKLLSHYHWLINSYTTDYFTLDIEKKFPRSFSKYLLDECTLQELAFLLPRWKSDNDDDSLPQTATARTQTPAPLSFIAFKSTCHQLALNQDITSLAHQSDSDSKDGCVFGTSLEKYFRVCVKAKKRHEVDLLADMLSSLCKQNSCEHVVDIGAGLGHLSRLLTFNKHLKVTTIEASDSHSPKAQRLDRKTESLLAKQQVNDFVAATQPNHISHWIDSSITTQQFIDLIKQDQNQPRSPNTNNILSEISTKMSGMLLSAEPHSQELISGTSVASELPRFDLPWTNRTSALVVENNPAICLTLTSNRCNNLTNYNARSIKRAVCAGVNKKRLEVMCRGRKEDKVCLSGLHACGDLSATMIKVFVNLECAKVLSSVGCCYMKLSCEKPTNSKQTAGFPMSEYVRSLPHHENICTYESLEMGCHSLSQYRQRLINEETSLRRHVVRSVLQILLYRRKDKSDLQFKRLKIKNSEKMPFREYCERAFKRLNLPYDVTDEEITECETMIETHWRAVVGAYTVRLALAPLVEAYVLLDRMIYLYEHGIQSRLIPIFDPMISPRNMALVAVKDVR